MIFLDSSETLYFVILGGLDPLSALLDKHMVGGDSKTKGTLSLNQALNTISRRENWLHKLVGTGAKSPTVINLI